MGAGCWSWNYLKSQYKINIKNSVPQHKRAPIIIPLQRGTPDSRIYDSINPKTTNATNMPNRNLKVFFILTVC
nr:MAG TPA: hypothetical protein [Caudoviricetes sp.]